MSYRPHYPTRQALALCAVALACFAYVGTVAYLSATKPTRHAGAGAAVTVPIVPPTTAPPTTLPRCVMLAPALSLDDRTHHYFGAAFDAWANAVHASDYSGSGVWTTASGVVVGYAATEDGAVWTAPDCP